MLTEEQKQVIRGIIQSIQQQQVTTFGGVAGCGKTAIISVIQEALLRKGLTFQAAAYTGKATNVLMRRGVAAKTIHSCIYQRVDDDEDGQPTFRLMSRHDIGLNSINGFIIDEASMVSKEIHNDLISLGKPIIYVGDHGQLEPVGTAFNLMANPNFKLETVHRNAGEIAHFAHHLRMGRRAHQFVGSDKVQVCDLSAIEDRHLGAVDQIIVAFNKTRVQMNHRIRVHLGIDIPYITVGERIICLRNNRLAGLFNGMQGVVTKVHKSRKIDFMSDGVKHKKVLYDEDQFGKETNQFDFNAASNPFDYAYAITAHKAQGDQFGHVIVIEQECSKWDHVRWSYTAASRAMNGLIWAKSSRFVPTYSG